MDEFLALCCWPNAARKSAAAPSSRPAAKPKLPDPAAMPTLSSLSSVASSGRFDRPEPQVRPSNELKNFYRIDWSPQGEVGSGHFGKVFKGVTLAKDDDANPPLPVACKRVPRSATRADALHNEIRALAACAGHPNIIALYDVFYDDLFVIMVLELGLGGELFARIVKGGAYSERDASKHAKSLASAMAFMHSRGIVHRDLKPENLILQYARLDSPIKISDFGLSKILIDDDSETMKTVCGTRAYSAPEVNFGQRSAQYTAKVDVWSLGVILYIVLGGYHPFDPYGQASEAEIWARACRGEWDFDDAVWDSVSDQAKFLLSSMICVDANVRYDANQVLQHPWIAQAEGLPMHNVSSVSSRAVAALIQSGDSYDKDAMEIEKRPSGDAKMFIQPVAFGQQRQVVHQQDHEMV